MASTIITKNGTEGGPSSLSTGELAINTTTGQLFYGSTGGTNSVSSSFSFGHLTGSTISCSGAVTGNTLKIEGASTFAGLTANRVVLTTTGGRLATDSDISFENDTLTVTKIAAFEAAGAIDFSDENMTNVDINSGTIDGTDVTVGSGKTLDVSAGTLTTSAAQKKAIVTGGKNYRIVNASFRDDIGTDKHYLPLKSQDEQTALTREEGTELAVCDGRLVSATVRVENLNTHSGNATLTIGVETNDVGDAYATFDGTSETEALTVADTDDHHIFHFVFSTDPHWSATDMFAISIQSNVDIAGNQERFFVTLVIEDDWSTYLAGSSREIDTTP
jgi:hypothetical protein